MEEKKSSCTIVAVDSQDFVFVDGVRLGRLIRSTQTIQIVDRDKQRSQARGSRYVEVSISALNKLIES